MWDLLLNEDEAMIADSVREFLTSELPIERLRPHASASDNNAIWQGMVELGWMGVALPEAAGGVDLSIVEEMLILRECGRHLVTPSLMSTMLAGHVAYHAGQSELAAAFARGEPVASLAIATMPSQSLAEDTVTVNAFDWRDSNTLLLWNDKGMGLYRADSFADVSIGECLDNSLTLHTGILSLADPLCWVSAEQAPLALRANVLLSAQLVGLAEHASDLAVTYAKVREQFGKPIGSFQAVKHRCADMGVRSRLSWYQTSLACLKLQANADDATLQVASAKLLAADAAHENGRAGIQIHGGIGYQEECDAHWFVKRAFIYDQAGGSMQEQSRRVIAEPSPC